MKTPAQVRAAIARETFRAKLEKIRAKNCKTCLAILWSISKQNPVELNALQLRISRHLKRAHFVF